MNLNKLRNYNKIGIAVILSIGIIVMTIIYILLINPYDDMYRFEANKGIVDIKQWNSNRNIRLEGEWEFYPNVLLSPEDDFNQYDNIKKYVQVPGTWKLYLNDNGSMDGSGTYRLKINLSKDDNYGFKTRTIRHSSRIFVNGNEIINVGNPSINRKNYIAESKYKIGFSKSQNQELDLIVNVTNYDYITGGIISPIEFGTFQSILKQDRIDRGVDGLAIFTSIVLGLYFIMIYFQRGKDKELLYFGVTSIFIGIYVSTLNEQLLNLVLDYDLVTRTQIQMITLMLLTICLLRFLNYFFKEYINKKLINVITGIAMVNVALILSIAAVNLMKYITILQVLVSVTTFVCFIVIFNILIKSIIRKIDSLEYILIITSALFSGWFAMLLKVLLEKELGNLFPVLIFIMMINTSLLVSNKLQIDYKNAEILSKKLIRDDKLKDEFLARASHELSTPLHVILNSSQSLIEGKKGTLNSNQQESLFFINQEGRRLSRLVEDLLDASRINGGETQIRFDSIDPYRIIDNILREIKVLIPEDKDIVLINNVPDDLPIINSDSDKFTQIIYNLINNAIKHTRNGEIIVFACLINGQVKFDIKDTGIGIKEEDKEDIFKVFYKANKDTENPGMGLGLPITKHLVEILGGGISVESIYGKGSIFSFTLPISIDEDVKDHIIDSTKDIEVYEPTIEYPKDYCIDNPTILIVDDRLPNQKVMIDILGTTDFNLLFASDGKEAIAAVEKNKVDLIVLDFMLPDMYGHKVSREIRKKYSMVELPIIMLTASGKAIDFNNAFKDGANDFIKKPADPQELKTRIHSLLLMKKSVEEGLNKEFQYFYSQISPHFLYNTLNTIIGLSYTDPEQTRKALNNLSIYFRGKLELYKDKTLIPLEEELELVTAYLEIEQMRYGDRLSIQIDIDEDLDLMIPPLTLQPLVENSIRHGISVNKDGGYIKISAKRHSDVVIITIEDDGIGMSEEKQKEIITGKGKRLGFTNVLEKVKLMKNATLELESKETKGTTIKIIIEEVKFDASYISG